MVLEEIIITDLTMIEINNKEIVILIEIIQTMAIIMEIDQDLIEIIELIIITIMVEDLTTEIDKVEIQDLIMEIDH